MGRFFGTVLARPLPDGAEREFARALELALEETDTDTAIERMRAEFTRMDAPSDALLACLAHVLEDATEELRLIFWRDTWTRLPMHGYAAACYADVLRDCGRSSDAFDVLLHAVERVPAWLGDFELLEELAERSRGPSWLRYQLVVLRTRLDRISAQPNTEPDDQDADLRELYSELLEQYSDDSQAMAEIRPLGERISALEEQGVLPSVLVRRGDWRNE